MNHHSKRDIIFIIVGMLIAGALTVWVTVVGVHRYLDRDRVNDPLARAGGLSDVQKTSKSGPTK